MASPSIFHASGTNALTGLPLANGGQAFTSQELYNGAGRSNPYAGIGPGPNALVNLPDNSFQSSLDAAGEAQMDYGQQMAHWNALRRLNGSPMGNPLAFQQYQQAETNANMPRLPGGTGPSFSNPAPTNLNTSTVTPGLYGGNHGGGGGGGWSGMGSNPNTAPPARIGNKRGPTQAGWGDAAVRFGMGTPNYTVGNTGIYGNREGAQGLANHMPGHSWNSDSNNKPDRWDSTPDEVSTLPAQTGFSTPYGTVGNPKMLAYGGTAMHKAIVGDPQADGGPNPELVMSATPIHVMPLKPTNVPLNLPRYAYGTDDGLGPMDTDAPPALPTPSVSLNSGFGLTPAPRAGLALPDTFDVQGGPVGGTRAVNSQLNRTANAEARVNMGPNPLPPQPVDANGQPARVVIPGDNMNIDKPLNSIPASDVPFVMPRDAEHIYGSNSMLPEQPPLLPGYGVSLPTSRQADIPMMIENALRSNDPSVQFRALGALQQGTQQANAQDFSRNMAQWEQNIYAQSMRDAATARLADRKFQLSQAQNQVTGMAQHLEGAGLVPKGTLDTIQNMTDPNEAKGFLKSVMQGAKSNGNDAEKYNGYMGALRILARDPKNGVNPSVLDEIENQSASVNPDNSKSYNYRIAENYYKHLIDPKNRAKAQAGMQNVGGDLWVAIGPNGQSIGGLNKLKSGNEHEPYTLPIPNMGFALPPVTGYYDSRKFEPVNEKTPPQPFTPAAALQHIESTEKAMKGLDTTKPEDAALMNELKQRKAMLQGYVSQPKPGNGNPNPTGGTAQQRADDTAKRMKQPHP
jgi:hypothetical protein